MNSMATMLGRKQQKRVLSKSSTTGSKAKCGTVHIVTGLLLICLVYALISWQYLSPANDTTIIGTTPVKSLPLIPSSTTFSSRKQSVSDLSVPIDQCKFRQYPPHRYYGLNQRGQQPPDFLTRAEYIHGQWPQILPHTTQPPVKLCVNQSSWTISSSSSSSEERWPFADGTNPSILSMARIRQMRSLQADLAAFLAQIPSNVVWLATVCMTNSQCQWKDTLEQIQTHRLSTQDKPTTVRTILFLLDGQFTTVAQATIYLHLDHDWGKRVKQVHDVHSEQYRRIVAFDDARLFAHDGQVYMSYREGPGFGYESQVLNPLHLKWDADMVNLQQQPALAVSTKASETSFFCCGRNMALMANLDQPNQLMSLTWVDPVSVEFVDTSPQTVQQQQQRQRQPPRRLSDSMWLDEKEDDDDESTTNTFLLRHDTLSIRRQLSEKKHKSHIHGTNAFMVYIPERDEFLGVAHFHRPNDRQQNPYARFGHHYTHAFFTMSSRPPYRLTGLSAEFVYASPSSATPDAEIIQFSSGLEMMDNHVVLAYGINDCEAAVTTVPWSVVEGLLRPVSERQEVVHFMQPLLTKED